MHAREVHDEFQANLRYQLEILFQEGREKRKEREKERGRGGSKGGEEGGRKILKSHVMILGAPSKCDDHLALHGLNWGS